MVESTSEESDGVLAARLASEAGEMLDRLRSDQTTLETRTRWGWVEDVADREGHEFLMAELAAARPDDAVLSEEGRDDRSRLQSDRVWIVDPLDGSSDYGHGAAEWAIHVALTSGGEPTDAAVAIPSMGTVFSTHVAPSVPTPQRERPVVITGRSRVRMDGGRVARALDADLVTCGSAGVKAMLVVLGEVDCYVHAGPIYEWDVCAPGAVAEAAGLFVSDAWGQPMKYNQSRPVVPGFVVCRPEYAERVIESLS